MKGRSDVTEAQADEIRKLLALAKASTGMVAQEFQDRLRTEFRFVMADWSRHIIGPDEFDVLIQKGRIRLRSAAPAKSRNARPTPGRDPASLTLALAPEKARAVDERVPKEPGLYAVYGTGEVWAALGLGKPPDPRPLFVGKADQHPLSRELAVDFADPRSSGPSPTGSSELRRALAALLGYAGAPRNQANPGDFAEYGLTHEDDVKLTAWMRKHLKVAACPTADSALAEAALVSALTPPLNPAKKPTLWAELVKKAKARMIAEARAWGDR